MTWYKTTKYKFKTIMGMIKKKFAVVLVCLLLQLGQLYFGWNAKRQLDMVIISFFASDYSWYYY